MRPKVVNLAHDAGKRFEYIGRMFHFPGHRKSWLYMDRKWDEGRACFSTMWQQLPRDGRILSTRNREQYVPSRIKFQFRVETDGMQACKRKPTYTTLR